jgi:hypothetical protein
MTGLSGFPGSRQRFVQRATFLVASLRLRVSSFRGSFDAVQFRLDLCDALELGVAGLLQGAHSLAQTIQDHIPLVQNIDDAVIFRARDICSMPWRTCEASGVGDAPTRP